MKKIIGKFIDVSYRYNYLMIFFFVVSVIFQMFFLKSSFSVNSNLEALFDGNSETILDLKLLRNKIGSTETLSVISKSDSIEKNIEFFRALVPELKKSELIKYVEFEMDIKYLEERALLFLSLDELKEMQQKVQNIVAAEIEKKLSLEESNQSDNSDSSDESSSIETFLDKVTEKIENEKGKYRQQKYFSTADGLIMEIKIHPESSNSFNMTETSKVIKTVEHIVASVNPEKYGVTVETGGDFKNKLRQKNTIEKDLFSTIALCVFLLALTIIFYFRTFSSLLIILVPLSFGIMSAISVSLLFVNEFSLISAFSFAMLYGLGIDFAIHLLARYSEERAKGAFVTDALKTTYFTTLTSIISGALTTAAAFFSLIFVQFKGFSDFGIVAGIGVLSSLFSIVFFFPAFVTFIEKIVPVNKLPVQLKLLSDIFRYLGKNSKVTVSTALILLICSVAGVFFIKFEYDMGNLSYPHKIVEDSLYNNYKDLTKGNKQTLINRSIPNFVITESLEETKDVHDTLKKLINIDDKSGEVVRVVQSVYTFIPENQDEKLKIIKNTERIIERKLNLFDEQVKKRIEKDIMPLFEISSIVKVDELPEWIKDRTREKTGEYGNIVKMAISGNKRNINTVLSIKRKFDTVKGKLKDYKVLGTYFLFADIKHVIERELPLAIILALSVVFLILLLMFNSVKISLLILFPLITGVFYMILVANLSEIKFTLYNTIIIPTIVGIGIDSSIHIFHRFKNNGYVKIEQVLETTGGAILFSSFTTFTGFLSMAFATHLGIKSIGLMASTGIITVTVATLVVFPVILNIIKFKK